MLSMVFEVIQPDLEINRTHAATLLIPPAGGTMRATSGSSVEGFGQILAAALQRNPARATVLGAGHCSRYDGILRFFLNGYLRLRERMEWAPVAARRVTNRGIHGEPDSPARASVVSTDSAAPRRAHGKASDIQREAELLPGRKGKLSRTIYLFVQLPYKIFYDKAFPTLKAQTLAAYLIAGGSPPACAAVLETGSVPEYVFPA